MPHIVPRIHEYTVHPPASEPTVGSFPHPTVVTSAMDYGTHAFWKLVTVKKQLTPERNSRKHQT